MESHGQQCGSGPAFSRQPPPGSRIRQHRRERNVSRIGDWKQARPNGSHPPHPSASAYADTSLLPTGYAEAAAVIVQLPYVRRAASPRQPGVDRQRPFRPQQSEPVADRHQAPHPSRECGPGPVRPLEHRSAGPPTPPATQRECPPALLGGPAPGRARGRRILSGGRRHDTSPRTIGYRACDAPKKELPAITAPWPVRREECRVVRPRGELDLASRDAFAQLLRGTCRTTLDAWLIVDLTAVTFMDCTPCTNCAPHKNDARRPAADYAWSTTSPPSATSSPSTASPPPSPATPAPKTPGQDRRPPGPPDPHTPPMHRDGLCALVDEVARTRFLTADA